MTTNEELSARGKLGGAARASLLSPERRSQIGVAAAEARWGKNTPRATNDGVLNIGGIALKCYVLETGQRVLSQSGMIAALGMTKGSNPKLGGDRLANFTAGKSIKAFVSDRLVSTINNPLRFRSSGEISYGYEATVLVDICEAVLALRRAGTLHHQQTHIADRCELLVRGFARVGITALVDEATGYQADRAKDALGKILEAFIAKDLRPWVRTFPVDYYRELFRLRGWAFPPEDQHAKPPLVGKLTNWIIYDRLAPGVLAELRRVVERDEKGRLKNKLHQRLTDEHGHPKLREHMAVVVAMMKVSRDYPSFLKRLNLVSPKFGNTLEMELGDLTE